MNKNIKMLLIGGLVIVLGIILVVVGQSIATPDSSVLRDQVVEDLSFKNAKLEYINNTSTFEVEVANTLDKEYNLKYINIKLTGEENKEYNLIGYIGEQLSSNETKKITASIDKDVTDIINVEYSIVR